MSEQIDCLLYNHTQPSTPEPDSNLNVTCNASGMTYPQYQEQEILSYLTLTAYLTTFIFGTVGNALVLYIIAYYKEIRLKSVANYYIWNLALADEMFMLSLPLFCWATYTHYWPFSGLAGTITCKLAYVARDSNKFASIFLLVALSVDRCLASFHDLTHLRTIQVGKWVCVGMWFCCIILSMPFLMYAQTVPTRNLTSCRLEWPGSSFIYMEFWVFFQLFVGLILPSTVIFTSYYILYQRLKRISARRGANKIKRPNCKMSLTVIIVALTFVLCQIPYHILQVMALQRIRTSEAYRARGEVYLPSQSVVTTFAYLNASAQVLVFISSCVNPIIYGLLNDNYSKYTSVHMYTINAKGEWGFI